MKIESRKLAPMSFEKLQREFDKSADVSLDASRKGNRDWRIDVELNSLHLPPTPSAEGGFVACHHLGSFTTYAVNVSGNEVWFDQVDLALDLLTRTLKR